MDIFLKRIYEASEVEDGYRVLVDRLWPRGISKAHAKVDLWLKEIAPSTALRKWFSHDPEKWDEFKSRYFAELDNSRYIKPLIKTIHETNVTLIYSSRDTQHNHAVVLHEYLESHRNK